MRLPTTLWLVTLFSAGALAEGADAASITFGSTSAVWTADADVVELRGVGTEELSWGRGHSAGNHQQSAYRFDAVHAGTSAKAGEVITLGTFTHRNFKIASGQNLTRANLQFDLDFSFLIGGAVREESLSFDWLFNHNETDNNRVPLCADGNRNGIGNNRNGCADHVNFSGKTTGLFEFEYAEGTATLELLGFVPGTEFWTIENESNTTQLLGRVSFAPPISNIPEPVPLPAGGWLLLGGIAGLIPFRRRRRAS
jgi:hypothetical protein